MKQTTVKHYNNQQSGIDPIWIVGWNRSYRSISSHSTWTIIGSLGFMTHLTAHRTVKHVCCGRLAS